MKLKSYKEMLTSGQAAIDKALAIPRAAKAKKEAELKIVTIDEQVVTQELKIAELASQTKLDYDKIIDAQDELALLIRRRAQFEELVVQLFPGIK